MPESTNKLVVAMKQYGRRFFAPAGAVAALLFAVLFVANRGGVHAASYAAEPIDNNSVSALESLDRAVETVAARVTPAVVNIAVTSKTTGDSEDEDDSSQNQGQQGQTQGLPPGFTQFFGPGGPFGRMQGRQQQQIEHGIGSGIILSPDGYILTNNHVIDGAMQIHVTLHDRRVLSAKLVGRDKLTDLAVVKVDAHDLPTVAWGDSTHLQPGQTVLAFGSPFGASFQFSVTRGIVSAVDRSNPFSDDARKPGGFIQTDAAINPGNSGGALVDAHGELVGINTFIISNSGSFAGAGFAIPSQIAKQVSAELIKTGSVHHGYLGISLNDVTPENAEFFKLKNAEGAIVAEVTPDSPASRAGVKNGDVIVALNGQKIVNGSALQVAVSSATPGTAIELGVLRDGSPQTLSVKVGEYDAKSMAASNDSPEGEKGGRLGLALDDLSPDVRQQLRLPAGVHGVAVGNVRPGSPADDAGIGQGDVILEVNRKPVTSAQQLVSEVHGTPAGKDILLLVWSRGNASYRVVRPSNG